jgi:alpha-beta hydrolase superfamily lysophospholipase
MRAVLAAAWMSGSLATPAAGQAPPVRHTVSSEGHPMAVWEKRPEEPHAAVLLLHGRTWSTLPDFDLQVKGEDLSLMDGLVGLGYATYGLD